MHLDMILDGGIFGILANGLGFAALVMNIVRLATRGRIVSTRAVIAVAATALVVGVVGTGVGIYMASVYVADADLPMAEVTQLWPRAMGIAQLPTVAGAAWLSLNALLLGWDRR